MDLCSRSFGTRGLDDAGLRGGTEGCARPQPAGPPLQGPGINAEVAGAAQLGSPDGNEGLAQARLFLLDDDLDAAVFGAVGVGAVGDQGLVGAVALSDEAFGCD